MSVMFVSITVFTIAIILTARSLTAASNGDAGSAADSMKETAILERIRPLGQVHVKGEALVVTAVVPTSAAKVDGKAVYTQACFACHGTGAAGAPKLGDKGAWKARIALGSATLNEHAVKGFKTMPAKGGRADLGDAAVIAAVEYIVSESK